MPTLNVPVYQPPNTADSFARGMEQGAAPARNALSLANMMDETKLNKLSLAEEEKKQQDQENIRNIISKGDYSAPEGFWQTQAALTKGGYPEAAQQFGKLATDVISGKHQQAVDKLDQVQRGYDAMATGFDNALATVNQAKAANPNLSSAALDGIARTTALDEAQRLAKEQPQLAPQIQKFISNPENLTVAGITRLEAQTNTGQKLLAERRANLELGLKQQQADTASRREAAYERNANLGMDSSTIDSTARMIANGQIPMLSGFVLKTPWGQQVVARVSQLNPDYQSSVAPARVSTMRAFTSGTQGNTVRSLNVAISHLDTLSDLSRGLQNGDTQAVNKARNTWKTQTGNPAPTNFGSARDIVANEVVKAITASGGTLADREEAQRQIQASSSPAQLRGVIETWKRLLGGQLGGLRQQYEQGTGQKDFGRFLSPSVKSQLDALSGGATDSGQAPAAAQAGAGTGPAGATAAPAASAGAPSRGAAAVDYSSLWR